MYKAKKPPPPLKSTLAAHPLAMMKEPPQQLLDMGLAKAAPKKRPPPLKSAPPKQYTNGRPNHWQVRNAHVWSSSEDDTDDEPPVLINRAEIRYQDAAAALTKADHPYNRWEFRQRLFQEHPPKSKSSSSTEQFQTPQLRVDNTDYPMPEEYVALMHTIQRPSPAPTSSKRSMELGKDEPVPMEWTFPEEVETPAGGDQVFKYGVMRGKTFIDATMLHPQNYISLSKSKTKMSKEGEQYVAWAKKYFVIDEEAKTVTRKHATKGVKLEGNASSSQTTDQSDCQHTTYHKKGTNGRIHNYTCLMCGYNWQVRKDASPQDPETCLHRNTCNMGGTHAIKRTWCKDCCTYIESVDREVHAQLSDQAETASHAPS